VRAGIAARAPVRPERLAHPYFKGDEPIHMTIEVVEGLWAKITEADDWSGYEQVMVRVADARRGYDLRRVPDGMAPGFTER
jgi:serine/tyrosine/threonine adenylyltransferase